MKLLKTKDNKQILTIKEKRHATFKRTPIILTTEFLTEMVKNSKQ